MKEHRSELDTAYLNNPDLRGTESTQSTSIRSNMSLLTRRSSNIGFRSPISIVWMRNASFLADLTRLEGSF